ncbi:DUF4238 domain-containing protein [Micromonospora craniellae]|uniref:DUF4238 domain-containing protein n=1 Tax=Micromonospora craniellae TaxID=2294034 RepID=A0A372FSX2_9ACTN|nr:DUF4238 domain-containing protein [Micromonospora craniellae]QOC89659.1 DUF4238 domain-containing protein [Micromonospora craniellae]RFS43620.1 DUF4238 domain-containing protein [Micromonospora craniellae]
MTASFDPSRTQWGRLPPRLSGASLRKRLAELRESSEPSVTKQHLVSRVILSRFTEHGHGGRELRSYNFVHGTWRDKGVKGCGYLPDWMPKLSSSMEQVWRGVEDRLHEALDAVADDNSDDHIPTSVLQETVALHYVRSVPTRVVAQRAGVEAIAGMRSYWADDRREEAVQEFLRRFGRPPLGRDELMQMVNTVVQSHGQQEMEVNFRFRAEELLGRVSQSLSSHPVEILSPPKGYEFLIGDTPVVGYRNGTRASGPASGLGLLAAEYLVMPLTPLHAVRIPAQMELNRVTIGRRELEELNATQIRNAYREVYLRCSATRNHRFVEKRLGEWEGPPEIKPLHTA